MITLGNHTYRQREIYPYLDEQPQHRAAGQLPAQPARPRHDASSSATACALGVVNLSGNLFLQAGRPAFAEIDAALRELDGKADHVLVDMHAEATSEKVAHGLVPRRPRDRRRRHAHPRADRRRARAARAGPPTSPTSA